MKHLRMIALAAISAAALMAFVGAASASAATLCSGSGTGGLCPSGTAYTGTIAAELKPGTTLDITGALPMACKKSAMSGEVTDSSPIAGWLNTLTFSECTVFGFPCTFKSVNAPYAMSATGAAGDGTVNVKSSGNGNPGYTYTCLGVTCELQTGSVGANLGFEGSATQPLLKANRVPLVVTKGPGESCGQTATVNAEYAVTTPTSLWIS